FRRRFVATAKTAAESDEAAAVLAAIATGERHLVSRAQWDAFAATGTTHLMAISGLHVGLAATFAFAMAFVATGAMPSRGNRIVPAMFIGVGVAALYAWVSGMGVPARRAVLMLGLTAFAVARTRQVDIGAVVALAALIVFVTDPVAALAPGFNLSFGAVVLLLWLSRRRATGPWRPVGNIRQLFTMQVFLMFGLLALTAPVFQRFSLVAVPVNLLAVPLFSSVTVPLTLLALAIAGVSEACAIVLLRLAAASVEGLDSIVAPASGLPLAHFRLAGFSGAARLIPLVPLAWVLLPAGWPARRIAVLGVVAVVAWRPAPPPADCFDAWVLDVGQGLSAVVQTGHEVTVYDTGMAWRGGGSAAGQIVVPFLHSRGIARIERLIVSHGDIDHSGGARELLATFDVRRVIVGEALDGLGDSRCREGQAWWSGAIRFEVLHPAGTDVPEGNDASCVVRVSAGAHALLLTGDIESAAEHELVRRRRAALNADAVVVPHHGSLTSSSLPFVDSVHPEVAIVSASYGNRWG
ncbi:MAG: DNA internalization-related competence protein ComEC/Rec2, partial [Proteobacteria bacterium]|nr:DNA internalization-related competence protein ComEC/Rec2 [Pseudomonadota bacterium]